MEKSQLDKNGELILDAVKAIATFNGAGIAGVIALMQRPGPIPPQLTSGGGFFLIGLLFACASWVYAATAVISLDTRNAPRAQRRLPVFAAAAAACFGMGVLIVFAWAAGLLPQTIMLPNFKM